MYFRPNLNSIATRLILFGITVLVISTAARIFVLSNYLRKDVTELTSAQLLTLADYVARDIDRNIIERREFIERVADQLPPALLHNPHNLVAWLGERQEINPVFTFGFSVLDTSGKVLADYPVLPDMVVSSFADRDYFQQALKGEFTIGRPVIGQFSNVTELPMAMPIRDSAGKVRAVLVGVTAFDDPGFDSLQKTRVGATGGLMLVSPRDKLIIGATDPEMIFKPTPEAGVYPLHDRAMHGFRGADIAVNSRGVEELVAIATVPSSGWFIMAGLPTSEAFAPVIRLRHFILSNTLTIVVIFLLIVVTGVRYLLRPLKHAAEHADRMTLGEIPLEPLPVVRDDEVGHLTTAFNRVLTKLLDSQAKLEHIAHHDTLTGLPNRQLLADRMKQALARARRNQGKVAVLFLDLDGFKPINDVLGHEAGDTALCEVAERLRNAVRREDTLARVGGDEFVILLSDLNENAKDAVESVANKCLEVFQQAFIISGQPCRLGTSIGIAVGDGECSAHKLLIAADQAMYKAKEAGRGRFLWADQCALCAKAGQASSCKVQHTA